MISHNFPALIVVTPLILSFFINVLGGWNRKFCLPIVLIGIAVSLISSIGVLIRVIEHGAISYHLGGWEPPWGIEYRLDHLNAYVAVIVSFIAFLTAIYSKRSIEQELPEHKIPQFYTLFLLNVTGLLGITVTGDAFNLYVLLEIASFSAYGLIAIGEDGAPLASFRYVIMGTIGACFYLLGVGYLYIKTGSLNMMNLRDLLPPLYHSRAIITGFAFFMIGLAIKVALFPLHPWLPDAYTRAPSAVSAYLGPTMTKVGCYVMIRVMYTIFKPYFCIKVIPATTILGWMGAVAMIVGSIYAIVQSDLKRMLTYSIVANIGYIVLGIGLANKNGLTGSLIYILNEAFTKGCLFAAAGAIMYKIGTRNIYQFGELYRKMPFTMGAFTVGALSMVGIPPTLGFFGKLYLLLGSVNAKQWFFVFALLLSSVLNVIYYFNVIKIAYFKPYEPVYAHDGGSPNKEAVMDEVPLSMLIPTLIMAAGILVLGVLSGKIITTIIQFAIPKGF